MALSNRLLSGFVSPLVSKYADNHDIDALLMAIGIAMEGISAALFALAFVFTSQVYEIILIAVVILGIAQSFYHPLGGSIISYAYVEGEVSPPTALGVNGVAGSIGRAVAPGIITALMLSFGESRGLFIVSLCLVICAAIIFFGLSSFKRIKYNIRKSFTNKRLKLEPQFNKFLIILGTLIFIRSMFTWGILSFIGEYIYIVYKSKALLGIFLSVSFVGAIIGQALFGWLTTKKGGRYTVFITTIGSVTVFFLFLLWNKFIFSISMYFLETLFGMVGFPVLVGYITQVFPPQYTATASSYIEGSANMIGGALGTGLITLILGFGISIYTAFWIMLFFGFISMMMLPFLPRSVSAKEI